MAERLMPKYPIYVPSKGRYDSSLTMKFLIRDGVPFHVVIEEQEYDEYEKIVGADRLLVLPWSNRGLYMSRNWIKDHATEAGYARHWQLDDNIRTIDRWYKGKRLYCRAGVALRAVEDFSDRYENVAISGLNYQMFGTGKQPPFHLNCHVYSCTLINNEIPHRWRLLYNDDTDMCLQVLADGWCTALINVFLADKIRTMKVAGGNTKELYGGDGRLRMARSLERVWPGVVTTERRFQRPQHVVKDSWRKFDTPLKLREGIDLTALPKTDEYGMKLTSVKEVKSRRLRKLMAEQQEQAELNQTQLVERVEVGE